MSNILYGEECEKCKCSTCVVRPYCEKIEKDTSYYCYNVCKGQGNAKVNCNDYSIGCTLNDSECDFLDCGSCPHHSTN